MNVAKVKQTFEGDIMINNITLNVVGHGIETRGDLCGMSPRRIYDKLKIFKKESNALAPAGEPPQECKSLQHKLDRIRSAGKEMEKVTTNDDQASTSIITSHRKK